MYLIFNMSQAISEKINPNRIPLERFGLKAESSLNRITLNPSSASPGETLYINIPKLAENVVIVPGSVNILFDLTVIGHANKTIVNNVGRNLVTRLKVMLGGETLQDTQRHDLFQTYHDLYDAAVHNTKYCIPLDHSILSEHGAFLLGCHGLPSLKMGLFVCFFFFFLR